MLIQYAIVRSVAPFVVVETGVANGISTAYLLLACQRIGRGHVYSIDINNGEYLPSHKPTGRIVPDYLHSKWTLMLGDPREMLTPLVARLGVVDIFIHDSRHTYEHMNYEFQQAYALLRFGGFLLSDDVDFNSAFEEFVIAARPAAAHVISGIGVLKK